MFKTEAEMIQLSMSNLKKLSLIMMKPSKLYKRYRACLEYRTLFLKQT